MSTQSPTRPARPADKGPAKPKETPSIFGRKPAAEKPATEKEPIGTKWSESFTESELLEAMEQFRAEKRKDQLGETENLVINRPVTKGEGSVVIVKLASSLESNILERFEVQMTGFLRKTLRNDDIQLEKVVAVTEETKKLYTSKDKYEYMVKQNPSLKELKERLGLDFDY